MNSSIKRLTITLCLLLSVGSAFADVFDDITQAIKAKNVSNVCKLFAPTVEIKIDSKSNTYSKKQAEQVLKEFIDGNNIRSFQVIHKGESKQGAKYAICAFETDKGPYRAYIYVKEINGKEVVQELSFEKN